MLTLADTLFVDFERVCLQRVAAQQVHKVDLASRLGATVRRCRLSAALHPGANYLSVTMFLRWLISASESDEKMAFGSSSTG